MPITIYQNDHLDETKLLTPPKIFLSIFRFSTLELVEIDPNAAADPTQARSRALVFVDKLLHFLRRLVKVVIETEPSFWISSRDFMHVFMLYINN